MLQMDRDYPILDELTDLLAQTGASPWSIRLLAQLRFAIQLNEAENGCFQHHLDEAISLAMEQAALTGTLTRQTVEAVETVLMPLSSKAKAYRFICVAHAHIDMNWMWGYDETVGTTLDTFGTMLSLMKAYPTFTFSQSQASVYRIVETHDPDMFEAIRERVREGRWEVTASTWVETDKNMPSGESLSRHILYTKAYMRDRFGLDPDALDIDFEPDTFGHSPQVPEILTNGGVKYYYQCRGHLGDQVLYRWQASSGAEVVVYCEPFWYNAGVDERIAEYALELEKRTGGRTLLKVYGVGNHGGGPTRRDVERLIDMNSWPIYPAFTFGTLREYFQSVDPRRNSFPLKKEELNFLCDGCYTTQTRIKAGNRKAEAALMETEWMAAWSTLQTGAAYPEELFSEAWRKTLFNQFHDILPGSGVTETREYASGLYQEVFAATGARARIAARQMTDRIDTRALYAQPAALNPWGQDGRGEGGGAGSGKVGRENGPIRVFHLYNPLPHRRTEIAEITVWDMAGEPERLAAQSAEGNSLPTQLAEKGAYWDHTFCKLLVEVTVPAMGYATIRVLQDPKPRRIVTYGNDMRVQSPDEFLLENDKILVRLHPQTGAIVSFLHKETGEDLADPTRGMGTFRLVREASDKAVTEWHGGMSAWFVGRYKEQASVNTRLEMKPVLSGPVRSAIRYQTTFGQSTLTVTVSLDKGSTALRYAVACDWREFGSDSAGIPALHFLLPLPFACPSYLYDVPFGFVPREARDMDLPANSFVLAKPVQASHALLLSSKTKYGYRCHDNQMALTLIRGACDPDPTPETGHHEVDILVGLVDAKAGPAICKQEAQAFEHPFAVFSGTCHAGDFPLSNSLFEIEAGSVAYSGMKMPQAAATDGTIPAQSDETGRSVVIRLYETDGQETEARLRFSEPPVGACFVDGLERASETIVQPQAEGNLLRIPLNPCQVANVRISFGKHNTIPVAKGQESSTKS